MKNNIRVASLFSGIGGFEQGFKKSNMKYELVFASEIDKYATMTFSFNFPIVNMHGDIKAIDENDIPDHDLLCGGFPCQSFSIAGKRLGFEESHIIALQGPFSVELNVALIKQYGIEEYVIFHGRLFGDALTDVFNQCQFAIGSLARHRSGITHIKTLKNREYAGRGIPFIYSECDSDFDGQPYVLKAIPDESPINIQSIVDFMAQFDIQPIAVRNSVEKLSWKNQMQIVLDQCEKLGCLNKKG
jgi:hypothetical protein